MKLVINSSSQRSSKKRRGLTFKERRKALEKGSSLTITFPDGSIQYIRPDMSVFDGDWTSLALQIGNGQRVSWKIG